MSIKVYTATPRRLRTAIREAIEDGSITTWEIDADGDFTHSPDQWRDRAWMHVAEINPKESILFGIIGRKGYDVTGEEYALYHGRFAEMLLAHFDRYFVRIEISALATRHDRIISEEEEDED